MPRNLSKSMCQPCQSLITSMKNSKKRVEKKKKNPLKTPPKTMPLKFLTPKTRKRTLTKRRRKTYKLEKKLKKYENYMCTLGEEQGKELHDVLGIVNDNFQSELESLFSQHKEGDFIKKIWENDVKLNRTDFLNDQSKN